MDDIEALHIIIRNIHVPTTIYSPTNERKAHLEAIASAYGRIVEHHGSFTTISLSV